MDVTEVHNAMEYYGTDTIISMKSVRRYRN